MIKGERERCTQLNYIGSLYQEWHLDAHPHQPNSPKIEFLQAHNQYIEGK